MSSVSTGGRVDGSRPGRTPDAAPPRRIRLVAFDLDGTLLSPDLALCDAVIRAVGRLAAEGVKVVIVTGRMHRSAEAFARQLGLENQPLVSFNGAMVKRVGGDDVWWYRPIDTALAVDVLAFLAGQGLHPLVFDGDRVYAHAPGVVAEQYRLISGVAPEYVGDLVARVSAGRPVSADAAGGPRLVDGAAGLVDGAAGLVDGVAGLADGVAGLADGVAVRPTKILQVQSPDLMLALRAEAEARFGRVLNVTTSYPFFLEFMNGLVSKGRALAEVCRRLGLEAQDVAAFGDGLNDLDMIEWAGLGVAMEHGPRELIAAADAVAQGPPGEGVARFVEENLLGPGGGVS